MAQWSEYWRFVQPAKPKTDYVTSETALAYNNYTWYSQVIKGAGDRNTKYVTYEQMDIDVDIARALDTIAEEMSTFSSQTDQPLELVFHNDDDKEVDENLIVTLRAAARHWAQIQDFDSGRMFNICRYLIKYGDCFFRKYSDVKKWNHIDPKDILGIEIDEYMNIVNYHLRGKNTQGNTVSALMSIEVVPAAGMIHFSLSDFMGKDVPFGESILQPLVKTFRQLKLLEDAVVIYRISRAPERRVFYVDVGNMPAHKVKTYLESLKNDLRQRKMPITKSTAGQSTNNMYADSVYSAESVIEDFFMAQPANGRGSRVETLPGGCFAMDTKVSLLDGRELSIREIENEMANGKELWTYSCEPLTGRIVPGLISWAGVTHKSAKVMRITLDNGESFVCTPDHKFPTYEQEFKRAKEFVVGDSFIPLYRKKELIANGRQDYEQYFDNADKTWKYTHYEVANHLRGKVINEFIHNSELHNPIKCNVRHHKDFNRFNNDPSNLCFMSWGDHIKYHQDNGGLKWRKLKVNNPKEYQRLCDKQSEISKERWANLSKEKYDVICAAISARHLSRFESLSESEKDVVRNTALTNFLKGNIALNEKLKDPEFNAWYCEQLTNGWDTEARKKQSAYMVKENYRRYTGEAGQKLRAHLSNIQRVTYSHNMLKAIIDLVKGKTTHQVTLQDVINELNNDAVLLSELSDLNQNKSVKNWTINDGFTATGITSLVKQFGYSSWKDFRINESIHNHRIVKIEHLADEIEVGTLTIDGDEIFHNYHSFALSAGIFTLNSNLGEVDDLKYFRDKLYRGLRIPSSYMTGQDAGGAQYNDGKVGVAYIEELRFANFVKRLQHKVERVLDKEFKLYLKSVGIKIHEGIFDIVIPDPQNFATYRQAALDADLVNVYNQMKDIEHVSKRFAMKRYLGWSEEDIQLNEILLKQELNIDETANVPELQQIYDSKFMESREAPKIEEVKAEEPPAEEPEEEAQADNDEARGEETPPEDEASPEKGKEEPPNILKGVL